MLCVFVGRLLTLNNQLIKNHQLAKMSYLMNLIASVRLRGLVPGGIEFKMTDRVYNLQQSINQSFLAQKSGKCF